MMRQHVRCLEPERFTNDHDRLRFHAAYAASGLTPHAISESFERHAHVKVRPRELGLAQNVVRRRIAKYRQNIDIILAI
jgi:hypothetical protein